MREKIVVFADSMALPRGRGWGDLPAEATYPHLIDDALRSRYGCQAPFVSIQAERFKTIEGVAGDWSEQVELKDCQYIVVQVGGNDCAPRFLLPKEKKLISAIPFRWLRHLILRFEIRWLSKFISLYSGRVMVREKAFVECIRQLIAKCRSKGVKGLLFVNIPPPGRSVEQRLPGVHRKVRRYNQLLREETKRAPKVSYIDLYSLFTNNGGIEVLTSDGMHPNAKGQKILAMSILDHFYQFVDPNSIEGSCKKERLTSIIDSFKRGQNNVDSLL